GKTSYRRFLLAHSRAVPADAFDLWKGSSRNACLDCVCHGRDRGRLKQNPERNGDMEMLLHTRQDLSGQKRMAPNGKKIFFRSDFPRAQDLLPDLSNLHFCGTRWQTGAGRPAVLEFRKTFAIDFSVRSSGKAFDNREVRWHHVARQSRLEVRTEFFFF